MVSLEFSAIHIHDPSAAEAKSLMCLKNRLFFFVCFFFFTFTPFPLCTSVYTLMFLTG